MNSLLPSSTETHLSFWEHVEALRVVLVRVFSLITIGFFLSFLFYHQMFALLTLPLKKMHDKEVPVRQPLKHERVLNQGSNDLIYTPPQGHSVAYYSKTTKKVSESTFLIPPGSFVDLHIPIKNHGLMIFGPLEGFVVTLKTAFWMGLVGTSPLWLLLLMRFIAPALKKEERRLVIPFLIVSLLFLTMGMTFAFFVTIPMANSYLQAFNHEIGTNLWSFASYIDYTVILLLSNGLAFQLAVIGLFLVQLRVFKAQALVAKRRPMVLVAFIIGAVLTPPDVLTQLMLAVPLIMLYEMVILYARLREKMPLSQKNAAISVSS